MMVKIADGWMLQEDPVIDQLGRYDGEDEKSEGERSDKIADEKNKAES